MHYMLTRREKIELKAKLFRGLSDASRLVILESLRKGPQHVNEIVRVTGLSQPNASLHLECLWNCGLVDREPDGRFVRYGIRSPSVLKLLKEAEQELQKIGSHIAACARYGGGRRNHGQLRKVARSSKGNTHARA